MGFDKHLKAMEKYLKNNFPDCMDNYYSNIVDLIIKYKSLENCSGRYHSDKNLILLDSDGTIYHELAHMCFNDKEKKDKLIPDFGNNECFYSNGIKYYNNDGVSCISLNEGMAEFIGYDITGLVVGREIDCYFVDLLVSIYGKDILKYALLNDPSGFINDNRFYDISNVRNKLDNMFYLIDLISRFNKKDDIIFDRLSNSGIDEGEYSEYLLNEFSSYMTSSLYSVIDEFDNCIEPNISRKDFIEKLNLFKDFSKKEFDESLFNVTNRTTRKVKRLVRKKESI